MLLLYNLERYDDAERAYRKATELSADYAWAWAQLGQLLHRKLIRNKDAELAYRKATELEPANATAWVGLARLERANGLRKEAVVARLDNFLASQGRSASALNSLAWTVFESGWVEMLP